MQIYKSNEAPTTSTPGNVGDYYIDLSTDTTYKCTAVGTAVDNYGFIAITDATLGDSVYVWEKLGGAGGMDKFIVVTDSDITTLDKTFAEIQDAFKNGAEVELHSIYSASGAEVTQVYNMSGLVEGQMAQFDAISATGPSTVAYEAIVLSSGNTIQKMRIPFGEEVS